MRAFLYSLLGLSLAGAVWAICEFWNWVTSNKELAAGFITAYFLFLALIVALYTVRQMRHDRLTSIAMSIRQNYDSGIILEARELVLRINNELDKTGVKKINERAEYLKHILSYYKTHYPEGYVKLHTIPAFFDLIGWLVHRGLCDAKAIKEQIEVETPFRYWENYIREIQGKSKTELLDSSPTSYYGNFVALAKKLRDSK